MLTTDVLLIHRGKQFTAVMDFVDPITGVPIDISDRTYRSQIRSTPAGELIAAFTCQTSAQGSGLAATQLLFTLSQPNAALLTDARYSADLEETVDGIASIILDLEIAVRAPVTHDV